MAMTTAAERSPATPEEIWAILRETAELRKVYEKEADKRRKEEDERRRQTELKWEREKEEMDRKWAETKEIWDKADRRIAENNKIVGNLSNSFGEIVEHLVAPGMEERLAEFGLRFERTSPNVKIRADGKLLMEIDLLLENREAMLAVEIKARVNPVDIEKHEERLAKLRAYHGGINDSRAILGAMAGAAFAPTERKAALEASFFVIVQSGDTMKMDVPEGFKPKEW